MTNTREKQFKAGEIILSHGVIPWLAHSVSELVVKQSTVAKVELLSLLQPGRERMGRKKRGQIEGVDKVYHK